MIVQTARIGCGGRDELDVTAKNVTPLTRPFAPLAPLVRWGVAERRKIQESRERLKYEPADVRERHLETLERQEDWFFGIYRERYLEQLRRSYKLDRRPWYAMLAKKRVVLTCFCADHRRCHRTVLAECFAKLGAENRGEIISTQEELWPKAREKSSTSGT